MGKQINFYMDNDIDKEFIQFIFDNGYVLLYEDLENEVIITYHNFEEILYTKNAYFFYIYKEEFGELKYDTKYQYRLDSDLSPIIEFTRTIIKEEEKKVIRGRLWVEAQYYEDGQKIDKNPVLNNTYNKIVKWIKKNVPLQEITKGEYLVKEYSTEKLKVMSESGYRLM